MTTVVAIPWYLPENYARVVEVMADGGSFPRTHGSWRQKAARMERELKRQGTTPVRVELDPDAFLQGCARHGAAPDSAARKGFVDEAVAGGVPGTA